MLQGSFLNSLTFWSFVMIGLTVRPSLLPAARFFAFAIVLDCDFVVTLPVYIAVDIPVLEP